MGVCVFGCVATALLGSQQAQCAGCYVHACVDAAARLCPVILLTRAAGATHPARRGAACNMVPPAAPLWLGVALACALLCTISLNFPAPTAAVHMRAQRHMSSGALTRTCCFSFDSACIVPDGPLLVLTRHPVQQFDLTVCNKVLWMCLQQMLVRVCLRVRVCPSLCMHPWECLCGCSVCTVPTAHRSTAAASTVARGVMHLSS